MKKTYILSSYHLTERDQKLVRSLIMLLGRRLKSEWVLTAEDRIGDITLVYADDAAKDPQLQEETIPIFISDHTVDEIEGQFTIRKPIRSEDFTSALNQSAAASETLIENHRKLHIDRIKQNTVGRRLGRFIGRLFGRKKQESQHPSEPAPIQASQSKVLGDYSDLRVEFNQAFESGMGEFPAKKRSDSAAITRLKSRLNGPKTVNVVLIGSSGVGKSSLVDTISDISVVHSDVGAVDSLHMVKKTTTVGVDYGEFVLPEKSTKFRLFGNPGQTRFQQVWNTTSSNADVFVILVDMSRINPPEDLFYYWTFAQHYYNNQPIIVGKTHMDLAAEDTIDEETISQIFPEEVAVLSSIVDPRDRTSVQSLFERVAVFLENANSKSANNPPLLRAKT